MKIYRNFEEYFSYNSEDVVVYTIDLAPTFSMSKVTEMLQYFVEHNVSVIFEKNCLHIVKKASLTNFDVKRIVRDFLRREVLKITTTNRNKECLVSRRRLQKLRGKLFRYG